MAKNYLLTYAEQLATDVELLCQNIKAPSNTLFQIRKSSSSVYANIREANYGQSNSTSPTRSVASHQAAGGYTLARDEIQGRNAPLMICTTLRAVMIYQACGLDKKEVTFGRQKLLLFWWRLMDSNHRPHACEACALTS